MWAASSGGMAKRFRRFGHCWPAPLRGTASGTRWKLSNRCRKLALASGPCRHEGSIRSMRIDILTLFPEICRAPLGESMMKRAQENKIVDLRIHNLRDWAKDKHRLVDDAPFGGGQGMVMKPEPIFAAVEEIRQESAPSVKPKIVLMSPAGLPFNQ